MKTLSTVLVSSFVAIAGTAYAAKDPDRVTGSDRAAQAQADRDARMTDRVTGRERAAQAQADRDARMAARERNPNAATPATRAIPADPATGTPATRAVPAIPAKKSVETDTSNGTTSGAPMDSTSTRGSNRTK